MKSFITKVSESSLSLHFPSTSSPFTSLPPLPPLFHLLPLSLSLLFPPYFPLPFHCPYPYPLNPAGACGAPASPRGARPPKACGAFSGCKQHTFCHLHNNTFVICTVGLHFDCVLWGRLWASPPQRFGRLGDRFHGVGAYVTCHNQVPRRPERHPALVTISYLRPSTDQIDGRIIQARTWTGFFPVLREQSVVPLYQVRPNCCSFREDVHYTIGVTHNDDDKPNCSCGVTSEHDYSVCFMQCDVMSLLFSSRGCRLKVSFSVCYL